MTIFVPDGIAARFGRPTQMRMPPDRIGRLRFYQFGERTARFFFERFGRTNITLEDSPHYRLALALSSKAPDLVQAERYYVDYLRASSEDGDNDAINSRIDQFKAAFDRFSSSSSAPLVLTQLGPSEDHYIVDGNHRAAFAAVLGKPVVCEVLPFRKAYESYSGSSEFYGTGASGVPYQSVWFQGDILVRGRRVDALDRLKLIPPDILHKAKILDIASNIGTSSILAWRLGARECVGLEISQQMADTANRFAMLEGIYPAVSFRRFDLDVDRLEAAESFDIAFMFSIYRHLKDPEVLKEIVTRQVRSAVVFEAHPGDSEADYRPFFESGLFRKIEKLGALHQSTTKVKPLRPLWLLSR